MLSFAAIHAGHKEHCQEEDCPLCMILKIFNSTNKILLTGSIKIEKIVSSFYIYAIILSAITLFPATLVSQKIKLVI